MRACIEHTNLAQYTPGSASVTFGKIKRKLKAKASGTSGGSTAAATPKKAAALRVPRTPKSGKRGATENAATGTPSKKGKKATKPAANDDDDEEFGNFDVKKEEVTDINNGADTFFQEATAYAAAGEDRI